MNKIKAIEYWESVRGEIAAAMSGLDYPEELDPASYTESEILKGKYAHHCFLRLHGYNPANTGTSGIVILGNAEMIYIQVHLDAALKVCCSFLEMLYPPLPPEGVEPRTWMFEYLRAQPECFDDRAWAAAQELMTPLTLN